MTLLNGAMGIKDNFNRIRSEADGICRAYGRDPESLRIIAVSKTHPAETVQEAIESGILLFGENKVQEAQKKIPLLTGSPVFHLVGHLQSNKTRQAVALFDLIHSIDRLTTAAAVNDEAARIGKVQKVLVQVNTSYESSKNGVSPDEAATLVHQMSDLKNIDVRGLMTIGPFTDNIDTIRKSFRLLKNLLDDINSSYGMTINELSMGMTSDYHVAIEEGATMIRIGTAIFGQRDYDATNRQ